MGMANTLAQSFKNLPDTPSVPAASLTLHACRRFDLYLIEVFGNLVMTQFKHIIIFTASVSKARDTKALIKP